MDKNNPIAMLSKSFALKVVWLYNYLKDTKKEFVLSKQFLRSGTSIGANIRESIYAQSRPDFLSKMSIALKEASETEYWLELLYESGYIDYNTYFQIYDENCKITATLINIIKTTKQSEK